jgi:hypothetical protein
MSSAVEASNLALVMMTSVGRFVSSEIVSGGTDPSPS